MIKFLWVSSKRITTVAEVALWLFVGTGVLKVLHDGVHGLSSLLLAGSMSLLAIGLAFQIIAVCCKIVVNITDKE